MNSTPPYLLCAPPRLALGLTLWARSYLPIPSSVDAHEFRQGVLDFARSALEPGALLSAHVTMGEFGQSLRLEYLTAEAMHRGHQILLRAIGDMWQSGSVTPTSPASSPVQMTDDADSVAQLANNTSLSPYSPLPGIATPRAQRSPRSRQRSKSPLSRAQSAQDLVEPAKAGFGDVAAAATFGARLHGRRRRRRSFPSVDGPVSQHHGSEFGRVGRVELPPGARVEFITDVEGNLEYFEQLVSQSEVLRWTAGGTDGAAQLELAPDGYLIHGGDAVDKGTGDIRIVRHLTQLKRTYPYRVFLILGNRDINKLRFATELLPQWDPRHTDVFWDPKCKRYAQWLDEQRQANDLRDGRVAVCQWMLECTMGCQTTFETRRTELVELYQHDGDDVTDYDVVDSFVGSVSPESDDPWMLEYLQLGQLALVLGDALVVHGAISTEALGYAPGGTGERCTTLLDWCGVLNEYAEGELEAFVANPMGSACAAGEPVDGRAAAGLMAYAVPNPPGTELAGRTVIYNDGFIADGNSVAPEPELMAFLAAGGVHRVLVGHKPHGDCPAVVRFPGDAAGFILCCDTSYSDIRANKSRNPADNRGTACATVRLTATDTLVAGVLASGEPHSCTLTSGDRGFPDKLVGRGLTDGSWVKTVIRSGENSGRLLCVRGEGFRLIRGIKSVGQVVRMLREEYRVEAPRVDTKRVAAVRRRSSVVGAKPLRQHAGESTL